MQEFLDIAFSLPTVVFTVSSLFFIGFWVVTTAVGAGTDALDDLDLDLDADADVDIDVDVELGTDASSSSLVRGALEFLGVGSMPLLMALSMESLFAWLSSMILMTVTGGAGGPLVAVLIFLVSAQIGLMATKAIARRWSHVLKPTHASKRRDFVGSVCTISTDRVTTVFGQAEVRDEEGGSLLVQVRCRHDNDLRAGDRALIYDLDSETGEFHISADRSLAP